MTEQKKSAQTVATVRSAKETYQEQFTPDLGKTQDPFKNRAHALDDIYPKLYYAERMAQYFNGNYFPQDSETFYQDEKAKEKFVYDYEQMQAQIYAIKEILFDIRVQAEFALGVKSMAVKAHITNETEMEAQL